MEHEKDGYVGEFMGADKRIKDGHWFKGTHFKLGGNQQTVMKSHSHTQFQPPQRVQTAPGTYDAKSMTRTHFLLGNEKNLGTTTANASYQAPGSDFVPSSLDKDVKAELRKSHLNLGGEPYGRYTTTNKYDYAPKIGSAAWRYEQEERKVKMRKHNFNFGKEGSDYVSTHNASFQGYGKQGATNMLSKSSTDIGRTHFTLGGENAPMTTVNQSEYVEKSGLSSGKTKDSKAFQQTNFKFGTDKANHMPSSHMHYRYYPHGETEKKIK